jgi:hypothetical protein
VLDFISILYVVIPLVVRKFLRLIVSIYALISFMQISLLITTFPLRMYFFFEFKSLGTILDLANNDTLSAAILHDGN